MKNLKTSILLFLLSYVSTVLCRRTSPLLEDRAHRKPHRTTSECQFGKQHKELGSSWFADLGPPFGVMYCIKCECIPVKKKRRIIGRVECRNIAKECVELNCEDQMQLPGHCCKTCRNETSEFSEMMRDVSYSGVLDEEEKSSRHYAALLTSSATKLLRRDNYLSADRSPTITTETIETQLATGRFILFKRNLYYSFYASSRPTTIYFTDSTGNVVLEEQTINPSGSVYQNSTDKICGVWRRLSREYRRLLKDEKLIVTLSWGDIDSGISGYLTRYRSLPTEMFSSLMRPVDGAVSNFAGSAIISISTVSPSIYVMVIFSGLVNDATEKGDTSVSLRIQSVDKEMTVIDEIVRVEKSSADLSVVEVSAAVGALDLQALSRQRLVISLSSRSSQTAIEGRIIPRVCCELFQTTLSSSHLLEAVKHGYRLTRASGLSWMFIDKNGMLQFYNILDNVADPVVELVTARHFALVEDLTRYGVLNGSTGFLNPKNLEQLYNEELAINVANANNNNPSLIRGRLVWRPVADSRDSKVPYLLKRLDSLAPADMVGLIWVNVDNECNLHYDVSLSGAGLENRQLELYLEDIPFVAPGAPVTRRLLEEFSGVNVEGYMFGLSHVDLLRLESGIAYLDLWDMKQGQSLLRAQWKEINVPTNCVPHASENSNNIPPYSLANDESEQPEVLTKCFHGSQFYEQGAQWTSTVDECTMCNCNRGAVKCDPIICPTQNCSQSYIKPGSCCPSCVNSSLYINDTVRSSCSLGGQTFVPGSMWHPYIPPNGFDTCTICHCDVMTSKVKCRRVDCPPLNCDERSAYRPDKKACCKICPSKAKAILPSDNHNVENAETEKSEKSVLLAGGCKYPVGGPYENGKEWHPRIYSHGIIRCVTCKCKDGNVKCERKKCTKWSCDDPCCINKSKCTRHRRYLHAQRPNLEEYDDE